MQPPSRVTRTLLSTVAAGGLLLAACGSESGTDSSSATTDDAGASPTSATADPTTLVDNDGDLVGDLGGPTTYPLTIDNCGQEQTFEQRPERVVILNGTSVAEIESFLILGIEDSIVANSQSYGSSDVEGLLEKIAAVPTGGVSLNENFEVPKEQVLAQKPDLVVSTWSGGFSAEMGSITRDELDQLGINSFVTPVNCSYGNLDPRPEDQTAWDEQTYEASFQLLADLGRIFDAQDKAASVIADARTRIDAVSVEPGPDAPGVLIAYPGMSAMNANGLPAVFGGSFYDSVIAAAGGINSFPGRDFADMGSVSAEEMAAADVDVLVVGLFAPGEDAAVYAQGLFDQFPNWPASKTKTYTSVSESVYLGPYNAVAIEKIAEAIGTLG
ncbi:MAG: ABC transporter substrate-binding protein [Acidimicrobiales bacterium]